MNIWGLGIVFQISWGNPAFFVEDEQFCEIILNYRMRLK